MSRSCRFTGVDASFHSKDEYVAVFAGREVAIHFLQFHVGGIKKAHLKNLAMVDPVSATQVKLEFTTGDWCDIACKDAAQADEVVAALDRLNPNKKNAKTTQGTAKPSSGPLLSPLKVSPPLATSRSSRRPRDEFEAMGENRLDLVGIRPLDKDHGKPFTSGVDSPSVNMQTNSSSRPSELMLETPPPSGSTINDDRAAKQARISARVVTTNGSPDKGSRHGAGSFAYSGSRLPRREVIERSGTLQLSRKNSLGAAPQSSALYRGYRSSLTFGLQNLGNTCYLNAVMQALCSLREFVTDLRAMPDTIPQVEDSRLFTGSSEILRQMSNASAVTGPSSPAKLRELIARASPMFAGNQQQDAHEFLLEYINQLHDELLGARQAWLESKFLADTEVNEAEGVLSTQAHLDSEVKKTLQCSRCYESREVFERFRDFSLDFPAPGVRCELRSMLRSYFAQETLEAKCEYCTAPSADMSKQLTSAPRVLVLHLKRFVPNVEKQRYDKQHQIVGIEPRFDLKDCLRDAYAGGEVPPRLPARPMAADVEVISNDADTRSASHRNAVWEVHLDDGWVLFDPLESQSLENAYSASANDSCELKVRGQNYKYTFGTIMDQVNKDTNASRPIRRRLPAEALANDVALGPIYDLRSVIAHDGASPHSGHYVCYARGAKGNWRLYDDSQVREIPADKDLLRKLGEKAYILFYVLNGRDPIASS